MGHTESVTREGASIKGLSDRASVVNSVKGWRCETVIDRLKNRIWKLGFGKGATMKYLCTLCWLTMALLLVAPAIAKDKTDKSGPVKREVAGVHASLYERLGGETVIRDIVDQFVTRISANPSVNLSRDGKFGKADVSMLKRHLVDFIGSATGGKQKYIGRDLTSAHAGMKISEAEFNALASDLEASLDHLRVPAKEKSEVLQIASSTKHAIVGM